MDVFIITVALIAALMSIAHWRADRPGSRTRRLSLTVDRHGLTFEAEYDPTAGTGDAAGEGKGGPSMEGSADD